MHSQALRKHGETAERLFTVAAWRDAPYFTEAERAALALAEAVTRLSDQANPVPDDIWQEATRHYDEAALAALLTGHCDRQRLEPAECRHAAGCRRLACLRRSRQWVDKSTAAVQ